jgi:phage terminase large subunit-like protein
MTSRKTATKRKASSRDDASKGKPEKPRGKRPAADPPAPFDPVTAYARDAVDGKILVNKWVRLACERHLRDLEREDLVWDLEACNRVIAFFRVVLRLNAGEFEGQPFVLQPWQAFIVGSLFGWKGLDGWRRFRVAYIEIAKGNGKSPMAAGIGLYMLTADGEARAQVFAAARTKDQAMVLFRDAVAMVEQSPQLKRRLKQSGLAPNVWSLAHLESRSFFRSVSSEDGKSGPTPHCALVDELHEHSDATVVDMLRAGTKSRRQALIVEITNSGFDPHSVCGQHRDHSEKVLEGIFDDDSRFAFVCGLDEGDDWLDESAWRKANPNLGVSIQLKYLRELVREAEISPAKQNTVKRLNFCIWTQQSTRSIDMVDWDKPAAKAPFDPESLRGRRCFAGLDLARIRDLSSLGLVFPPVEQGELWKLLAYFWVPEEDILQRSKRDHVPYDVWARQGLVRTTPGNTTDFDFIYADIVGVEAREGFPRREGISEVYVIEELAFDRVFAGELVLKLADAGLSMVEFGQGFLSMAEPCAAFHRMVRAGELRHGGNPVLTWNVSNLSVKTDPAGNMKPDKEKSIERIDGVVAVTMGLGRALRHQPERSGYEDDTEGLMLV